MSSLLELLSGVFVLVYRSQDCHYLFLVGSGTGPLTCEPFFFTVSMIFFADASTS